MYYLNGVYAPRAILAVLLDAACFMSAFGLTWVYGDPPLSFVQYALLTVFGSWIAAAVLFFNDAYKPGTLGDGPRTVHAILTTMGFAFAAGIACYFLVDVPPGATATAVSAAAIYFPLLLVARLALRLMLGSSAFMTNVVVVGATDLGLSIARLLHERRDTGIHMLGFISDDSALHHHDSQFAGFRVIARPQELEKVLLERKIDCIVVASKDRREHFPADTLMRFKMESVLVESGVAFLERLSGRIHMRDLRASYLIFGRGFSCGRFYRTSRRLMDIVGASMMLLLASPVLALAALCIKLESKGPVLYRQCRLGKGNKPFMMIKLRSMCENAESKSGAVFTSNNDDRITRVGYFIRRTRLDELPQLWNVLVGDMSLVGPRAERPEFAEILHETYPYYAYRTSVRPGITGWAQTRFGYVNSLEGYEEKLALDLYYLKYRGIILDLVILAQTIKTVLQFRGM